ncbi:MAG TPA: MFS transporter, partial [Polyangiaceae bacterium]|nr:MFS transporter [Polyangiaceae bacterium]
LLFTQCFCVIAAAFVVGRTLGVTLFLQRVDPAFVPYTYAISAVGVSSVALVYARIADRFRRDHLIQVTALVFAGLCVVLRVTLNDSLWFLALVYVFFDVVGDISMIQLWTLASDVMSARQGKRLFAFVAAGGTIGGAVVGVALGSTVRLIGAPNLFFVVAALLLVAGLAARKIGKLHRLETPKKAKRQDVKPSLGGDVGRVLSDRYTLVLAGLLAIATLTTTLVDYQWKMAAREAYLGDEEGLAAYFSYFAVAANSTGLMVQLFVTSRLLERFGLRAGLAALPAALLTALSGSLALAGGAAFLWATTIAKGVDGALRYSINDPSVLVLYRPIPARIRGRAKAILGGVVKPLAAGAAGLCIAGLAPVLDVAQLAWVTLPLLAGGIALVEGMRRLYVRRLTRELSTRTRLDGDSLSIDAQTRSTLSAALSGDDRERALSALALLLTFDDLPFELPLESLLRSDREVASRTLELLATHGVVGRLDAVEAAMLHAEPEVRARAIAVVLLHGGLSSLLAGAGHLRDMLEDPDPEVRSAAAQSLAVVGDRRFFEPLLALLQDPEVSVRVAAAHAARRVPNPALGPCLAALLDVAATRPAARRALAHIGGAAVPLLGRVLETGENRSRLAAARALGDIGDPESVVLLVGKLGSSRDPLSRECARVLGRLAERRPLPVERHRIVALFEDEVKVARELEQVIEEIGEVEPELLGDALAQRWSSSVRHVLALASLLVPEHAFSEITSALLRGDKTRRANALELLDNMPLGVLGPQLIDLFDSVARPRQMSRAERLASLLDHPEPWVVSCVIYELALDERLAPFEDKLRSHPDPLVQETLQSALSGILVRRVRGVSIRLVATHLVARRR